LFFCSLSKCSLNHENKPFTKHSYWLISHVRLGAIVGGGTLILSPSGTLLGGLPLAMLNKTPFSDFLIPGIILFFVLGVGPVLLIPALLKKPVSLLAERFNFFSDMHWSWSFTIYTGFALIIWIQAEMLFISAVHWSHALYIFWALAIIFLTLLPQVRNLYKK